MKLSFVMLVAVAAVASGCAATSEDSGTASQDVTTSKAEPVVQRALAQLDAQMDSYTAYYDDSPDGIRQNGSRIAGCWANPAGKKLTDLQKAFYCSMPLEFRLCNTVKLLSTNDTDVEARYQGYVECKATLASALGDDSFNYSADVDQAYRHLFLEQSSDWAVTSIVEAKRPHSPHGFPYLLVKIVGTLAAEAEDLASEAFSAMIVDATDQI